MFDKTKPADLQALKDEVEIDPINMVYSALPETDVKKLLNALNSPTDNVGGESEGKTFSQQVVLDTWEPKGNLNETTPWIQSLIASSGDITHLEARYRANCGSLSTTALDAEIIQLSRAEVLFGQGTIISKDDWIAARDS